MTFSRPQFQLQFRATSSRRLLALNVDRAEPVLTAPPVVLQDPVRDALDLPDGLSGSPRDRTGHVAVVVGVDPHAGDDGVPRPHELDGVLPRVLLRVGLGRTDTDAAADAGECDPQDDGECHDHEQELDEGEALLSPQGVRAVHHDELDVVAAVVLRGLPLVLAVHHEADAVPGADARPAKPRQLAVFRLEVLEDLVDGSGLRGVDGLPDGLGADHRLRALGDLLGDVLLGPAQDLRLDGLGVDDVARVVVKVGVGPLDAHAGAGRVALADGGRTRSGGGVRCDGV